MFGQNKPRLPLHCNSWEVDWKQEIGQKSERGKYI